MSILPLNEKIVGKKKCRISNQEFFITDKDIEFYDTISPIFGGKKYAIPSPTLCPDERMRRRLSWRNERKLYHRKCQKTGNQIISIFSPDKDYTIYDPKVWNSDNWDPHEFQMVFDFSKPFFPQFSNFLKITPKPALSNGFGENSDYCNQCYYPHNCYLCFCSDYCEDSEYLYGSFEAKKCFDCLNVEKCENCYECTKCTSCHTMYRCRECTDSRDCFFCFDCTGCQNCFGSTNLRNKSWYFFNQSISQEEYKKRIKEFWESQGKIQAPILEKIGKTLANAIHKSGNLIRCESCTGDSLYDSKDSYECFEGRKIIESKFQSLVPVGCEHSYDIIGSKGAWNYENSSIDGNNIVFSSYIFSGNSNVYYSHYCTNGGQNLFGCSSLKKAHHCIFNKPYSVNEYETLCGKIIDHMRSTGEWGEFFPHSLSPFGYDETVAQEYFPMTEAEVKKLGWNWKGEEETSSYHGPYYTPLSIDQYDEKIVGYEIAKKNIDELLNGILQCEVTNKPFKVIRQELAFYIENHIPIPTKHPDQRHKERMQMRNPRKLFERKCTECQKEIITTYAPERPEKVVCEGCYQKLVY